MIFNIVIFLIIFGFFIVVFLVFMLVCNIMFLFIFCFGVCCICEFLCVFLELVFVGFFVVVFFVGFVFVIVVILLYMIGVFGKFFYEIIENIDMKLDEGVCLVGGNWLECICFVVLLQVLFNLIFYGLLCLEINVCVLIIIGVVGGGGIGEELCFVILCGFGVKMLVLFLFFFLMIIVVDQFLVWLCKKFVGEYQFLLVY